MPPGQEEYASHDLLQYANPPSAGLMDGPAQFSAKKDGPPTTAVPSPNIFCAWRIKTSCPTIDVAVAEDTQSLVERMPSSIS
jgi:hypothetical protein